MSYLVEKSTTRSRVKVPRSVVRRCSAGLRCNLWTGRESQRSQAICQFCDTDFVGTDGPGGGRFKSPSDLAFAVAAAWAGHAHPRANPTWSALEVNRSSSLMGQPSTLLHDAGFGRGRRDQRHPAGAKGPGLDLREP